MAVALSSLLAVSITPTQSLSGCGLWLKYSCAATYSSLVLANPSASRAGAEVNEDLRDGVASAGGYRGDLYYVPQNGILYERTYNAPANNPGDYIYLLDDGRLSLYATGRTEITDGYTGPDDKEHLTWFWNDTEVTAEEYEKKLNEETMNLSGDALATLFYVDKESMLSRLEKSMN